MLPTLFCSVSRQPQLDDLAGKASRSYDDGSVQVGDELPRPSCFQPDRQSAPSFLAIAMKNAPFAFLEKCAFRISREFFVAMALGRAQETAEETLTGKSGMPELALLLAA